MTPGDRALLLRVARRLEEQAHREYRAAEAEAAKTDQAAPSAALRKRNDLLGDARDLRELARVDGLELPLAAPQEQEVAP